MTQKPIFTHIKNISLGVDSELELVEYNNQKLIIKTFRPQGYKKESAVIKRNREYYYALELQKLGFLSLEFAYLGFVSDDQLCMYFLEDLQIFSQIKDKKWFAKLGKFIKNLIQISRVENTKLVTEKSVQIKQKNDYFEWLKTSILQQNLEEKFVQLGIEIIDELQAETKYLTLLHSDFHSNNIGLVKSEILLFDSGECYYLFGHKYHDITRQFMYFPEKVIFESEPANPLFAEFIKELGSLVYESEFQKFCFIQSLLITGNTFIPKRREICKVLYTKLKS